MNIFNHIGMFFGVSWAICFYWMMSVVATKYKDSGNYFDLGFISDFIKYTKSLSSESQRRKYWLMFYYMLFSFALTLIFLLTQFLSLF